MYLVGNLQHEYMHWLSFLSDGSTAIFGGMERIHLNDALRVMDKCHYPSDHETFSILYMKLDRRRGTGGQWVRVEKAQKCGLPYAVKDKKMRGLVDLASGKKTAIHYDLIYELNGMKIYKG